jgi:chitinase
MLKPRILILLLLIGIFAIIIIKQFYLIKNIQSCTNCPISAPCCSRWGFCGSTVEYCGDGCQSGACIDNNSTNDANDNGTNVITKAIFRCAFPLLNATMLARRFQGFKEAQWLPVNKDEAAIFLSHVSHETDGLQTYVEYCQRTNCKFVSHNYLNIFL